MGPHSGPPPRARNLASLRPFASSCAARPKTAVTSSPSGASTTCCQKSGLADQARKEPHAHGSSVWSSQVAGGRMMSEEDPAVPLLVRSRGAHSATCCQHSLVIGKVGLFHSWFTIPARIMPLSASGEVGLAAQPCIVSRMSTSAERRKRRIPISPARRSLLEGLPFSPWSPTLSSEAAIDADRTWSRLASMRPRAPLRCPTCER